MASRPTSATTIRPGCCTRSWALLLVANTVNIAADLGAMGNALQLLVGGSAEIYIVFFALLSLTLQIFIPFPRYAPMLKWLTLALLGYVATVLVVRVPWFEAGAWPRFFPESQFRADYVATLVAVLGHHDQPLPLLLAGVAGSRGAARHARARAAARGAGPGRRAHRSASRSTPGSA